MHSVRQNRSGVNASSAGGEVFGMIESALTTGSKIVWVTCASPPAPLLSTAFVDRRGAGGEAFRLNLLQHIRQMFLHFVIGKSQYANAVLRQICGSIGIVRGLLRIQMNHAVNFNRQPLFNAIEIQNDLAYGMLPPEFEARHLLVAQHRPQNLFSRGGFFAQRAGLMHNDSRGFTTSRFRHDGLSCASPPSPPLLI